MRFELEARPTDDGHVDVYAILELNDGTRTRWTGSGMSRESPPLAGTWIPVGYEESSSAEEPLLLLDREGAISLANELYAAAGLTEAPETGDSRDAPPADPIDRDQLLGFFGTYDKIALERHPRQITRVGAVSDER